MNQERVARLGIGVDYRNARRYPHAHGIDGIIRDFAPRLSHVQIIDLGKDEQIRHILEVADGIPLLHHLWSVQPSDAKGPNSARFATQNRQSELASVVWQNEDIGSWHIGPYDAPFFASPVLEREVALTAADNLVALNRETRIPFFPENPPCTLVAGSLSLGDFFKYVRDRSGLPMVLDLSHLYSYARLVRRDPLALLESFPLDSVVELHVAGGYFDPAHAWHYYDTHSHPLLPLVLELLGAAVPLCPQLRAVTFEISAGIPAEVFAEDFSRVEELLEDARFFPRMNLEGWGNWSGAQ